MPAADGPEQSPQRPPSRFGEGAPAPASPRAEAPRPPTLPPRYAAEEVQRRREMHRREATERRSMLRGLILLAVVVLVLAVLQFGWARAFPAGWWRRW